MASKQKKKDEGPPVRVLNTPEGVKTEKHDDKNIAKDLQKLMLKLKGEHMTGDGKNIDYVALKSSKTYAEYKEKSKALAHVQLESFSEEEKIAFCINVYNALTIHGLVEVSGKDLPSSVLDIKQFWKTTGYNIGGHVFSLDHIEHGILRGNRPHPASQDSPFKQNDPRLKYVVKTVDPRIHFALNCGARSCPAINVYTAENLNSALDAAAKAFIDQEVFVNVKVREIRVSRLFQWYRSDFGNMDVDAIRWIRPYLSKEKAEEMDILLDALEASGGVNIQYSDYNWKLNKVLPKP
ncbi:uncharacterized protein LOC106154375 [Lingula anatina]|uniref:Uncharacterized protein LOC106154375 n=1 Tax=Lingula anatina TaxID=7574 RepID=A0A1S3HF88_LINAN|nr:uncharacterized protein LOC106154375 [Lingula anatina]|eukprot:XP_013384161.1 uncharacterized protein LOC106154375 [Lingula anatina]